MSFLYWLSKFSQEAMLVELFLIGCLSTCYFGYLLIKKRRYGVAKKNIPDNVVRAFLIELIGSAEGFKNQLFGEDFKIAVGRGLNLDAMKEPSASAAQSSAADSSSSSAEIGALKSQLAAALSKQDELSKMVSSLNADKGALEAKLSSGAATPATGGEAKKALDEAVEKITKLESKLAEYEVIEDDLANLKKYQQENKQLRAQLEGLQGGAPAPAPASTPAATAAAPAAEPTLAAPSPETSQPVAAAPAAPAPTPEPTPAAPPASAEPVQAASPIAAAEESVTDANAAQSFEGLVDKVEESLAAPAGASANDPLKGLQAQTAPPAADVAAAPSAAAAAPAAAAPAEGKPEKSDADLLNEFERMLGS
ncbi:MAG: hypothetical protein AB1540_01525 [Bdellovibrionota bacterium]